jgi:hypothetical protein
VSKGPGVGGVEAEFIKAARTGWQGKLLAMQKAIHTGTLRCKKAKHGGNMCKIRLERVHRVCRSVSKVCHNWPSSPASLALAAPAAPLKTEILPRHVAHATHGEIAANIAHAAHGASMVPRQPLPVHKPLQIRCRTNTGALP